MNKRTLGLIVCLTVATGLAACSSGGGQAPPPAPAPAPAAAAPPPPPPTQPTPPAPPPGMTGRQARIAQVQQALNNNGAQLTVDGHMGPKTKAALIAYQKQHNLKATGGPDRETLQSLGV